MQPQVFTHAHAGLPSSEGGAREGVTRLAPGSHLVAVSERIIAVAAPHAGGLVELLDAGSVAEVEEVLGSGACKFRGVGSLAVRDTVGVGKLPQPVDITSLSFLRGGTLAVVGTVEGGCGECRFQRVNAQSNAR